VTTTALSARRSSRTSDGDGAGARVRGLILSGGKGSRLRPFTYTNAKQLVPIANKPVLFYAIEQLVEAGITEIGIVVGDTGEQVRQAAGDGSAFGARITYIEQEAPLGIAHGVKIARDYLRDAPFVLYLGDNFVLGGICDYVHTFVAEGSSRIFLHPVDTPEAFGIAELADGRVTRIVEKPKESASNLAVIGIYMLEPSVHAVIDSLQPSARGELEITDALQGLLDRGLRLDASVIDRYWIDTGKMDDILSANRRVIATLDAHCDGEIDEHSQVYGPVTIEKGARVINSVLRGPLVIGAGTEIIDSEIGPCTAINYGCRIKGCRIEDSIVMEDTVIEDIHWPILKSMIGRRVQLRGGRGVSAGYSLTLGDHSRIEMPDG
jgi:glucose-1-phosphate thymidylyltransferase